MTTAKKKLDGKVKEPTMKHVPMQHRLRDDMGKRPVTKPRKTAPRGK